MYYVVVMSVSMRQWKTLRRLDTLAEALAFYRCVHVGPKQAKALMQRDREGWHVLAHLAGVVSDEPTDQVWGDGTDQVYVGPGPY